MSTETLDDITNDTETVRDTFSASNGLTRVDDSGERTVDVAVVVVVTDERVYFVDSDAAAGTPEAGSLRYDELAAVEVDEEVRFSTVDGVVWRVPLSDASDPTVGALVCHLGWIGDVRTSVRSCANDVELAVGDLADATEAMDWESGEETYERQRDALDEVTDAVLRTRPVDSTVLAPELTDLERQLERAYADLLIERSKSRLTLGQQLDASVDTERTRDVLARAREDFAAARGHAEAVRRPDAFVFGEQRALRERLEELAREIQAVATEPLARATEATLLARSTSEPAETRTHWETAFERYETVHALLAGKADPDDSVPADVPDAIAGDLASVETELENAAGQLIGVHRTLARTRWDDGIDATAGNEDVAAGIEDLEAALEHAERAREIAAEYREGAVPEMDERIEKMRDGIERLQDAPTFTRSASGGEPDAVDERSGAPADAGASLAPHHEIRIDGAVRPGPVGETPDRTETDDDAGQEEVVLRDPTEER